MSAIIIKNGLIINRGKSFSGDVLIKNGRIEKISEVINDVSGHEIDAKGHWVIPGIIDDQVHFREPGITHKATIATESRAAIAGGVTSFMEMPNTKPPVLTQELLEKKYEIAASKSVANYSFYMGAGNENLEEVLKTDPENVCGIKIFMGSSTGDMLVDDESTLDQLFSKVSMLMATHCEDEETIRKNHFSKKVQYGKDVPTWEHPNIRSVEACYKSSSLAVSLAKKYGSRLHVLHISTQNELNLFDREIPLEDKKITSEVCVHHLFFHSADYEEYGNLIKCNPAIKTDVHQKALLEGLLNDRLDVIATDHAPHTIEEKESDYLDAPSGIPLIQHGLSIMLDFYRRRLIKKEKIIEKMCHNPAIAFEIKDRGFLDEGKWADIVILDPKKKITVRKKNILYKCGWSPLEGKKLPGEITTVIVNGKMVYDRKQFVNTNAGQRLIFERN